MKYTLTITADSPSELAGILGMPVSMLQASGITELPPVKGIREPAPSDNDADDGPADANAPDVDKRGFPWDERIHASSKTLNKDGTWRYRRNTAQDVIEKVEAEIKSAQPAPTLAEQTVDLLDVPAFMRRNPDGSLAQPNAPVAAVPVPTGEPAPTPIVPVPTGEPAAPVANGPSITYESIVALLTDKLKAGTMTPAGLPAFWQEIGVSGVNDLRDNPDALSNAYAKLALL